MEVKECRMPIEKARWETAHESPQSRPDSEPPERFVCLERLCYDLARRLTVHEAETARSMESLRTLLDPGGQDLLGVRSAKARIARLEEEVASLSNSVRSSGSMSARSRAASTDYLISEPSSAMMVHKPQGRSAQLDMDLTTPWQAFLASSEEFFVLSPSSWDCAVVVALHQGCAVSRGEHHTWWLGRFNIILVWLLVLVCCIAQGLLLLMLSYLSASDTSATQQRTLESSQLVFGHAFANLDFETMMSQSQQRCAQRTYDSVSHTIGDMAGFLQPLGAVGNLVFSMSLLNLVAMVLWAIESSSELRRCIDCLLTVARLPTPPSRRWDMLGTSAGPIVAGATSGHKAFAVACVLLPRMAVAIALLFLGNLFLARSTVMQDLVLLLTGLMLTKQVDAVLFRALASPTLMHFISAARIRRREADAKSSYTASDSDSEMPGGRFSKASKEVVAVLLAIAFVSVTSIHGFQFVLRPFVDSVSASYDSMCGNSTDFTYLIHPVTEVPMFSNVATNDVVDLRCFYAARHETIRIRAGLAPEFFQPDRTEAPMLTSLVNGSDASCQYFSGQPARMACPDHSLDDLLDAGEMTLAGYAASPSCRDQDVAFGILRSTCMGEVFYQEELGFFQHVRSCQDVGKHQRDGVGPIRIGARWLDKLRKVCAASCGLCGLKISENLDG